MDGDLGSIVGKRVLLGITYCHADGTLDRREQVVGTVEGVEPHVTIAVDGRAERLNLPPDPRSFQPATPGRTYRLKESGEVVEADLLSTWTVYPTS